MVRVLTIHLGAAIFRGSSLREHIYYIMKSVVTRSSDTIRRTMRMAL